MAYFFGEKDNTEKEENDNLDDWEDVEKYENWEDVEKENEMVIEAVNNHDARRSMLEEGEEDGERVDFDKENKENDHKEEKKMKGTGTLDQVLNFK